MMDSREHNLHVQARAVEEKPVAAEADGEIKRVASWTGFKKSKRRGAALTVDSAAEKLAGPMQDCHVGRGAVHTAERTGNGIDAGRGRRPANHAVLTAAAGVEG